VSRTTRIALGALATVVALESAALVFLVRRDAWRRTASDRPVQRGHAVAEAMGCFGCHGPGGAQPIANPGARVGEVPSWVGGTWRMWNRSREDLRAWILDGRPPGRERDPGALLEMPAYAKHLSPGETADLLAYVEAVSQFDPEVDERVAAGKDAAWRLGCFGCHGPEGRGLVRNPGSFKGYVPPWDGPDFDELVRGEPEFREWVLDGVTRRLARNPAARAFLARQAIRMPAYADRVSDADLQALYTYVRWVRANPRTGNPGPR
jgi:mono/diheme cytochrome c family protein